MLVLKALNESLSKGAKFSYLSTNYVSGVSSVVIVNSAGFENLDYVLFGEWGTETAEIVKVTTVTAATNTLALATATKFSHPESTKITILKYNQVKFYHTTTSTFTGYVPLGVAIDVQADDYFTRYYDTTYATGFGWYVFYNSTTSTNTQPSNPIPYDDFAPNSVKKILDAFFRLLTDKEKQLVSLEDAFAWLDEAHARALNELNLINQEYNVQTIYQVTTTSGTAEYQLPTAFAGIISVNRDSDKVEINNMAMREVTFNNANSGNTIYYYIRKDYIGFTPTPTSTAIYDIYFKIKSTRLTSFYDFIYLPNNNHYFLIDHMLWRASEKLGKPKVEHKNDFEDGIKLMKLTSVKQHNGLHSWGITRGSNV